MGAMWPEAKRPSSRPDHSCAIAQSMQGSRPHLVPLVALALLAACDGPQPDPSPSGPSEPRTAPLPVAEPPLDREALILAATRAASDWAARRPNPERQRTLDGRRFELKLRFGCPGEAMASRRASFDDEERVLRLRVEPEISAATPLLGQLELAEFEAVEGFWVHRPWLLEPVCPAPARAANEPETETPASPPDAAEEPAPAATGAALGIARFYTDEDSRTLRRETRAYETTLKLAEAEAPSAQGYDLVLSGRLASLRDGTVIACAGLPDSRPSCVISARFDHVAVVRPDGEVLAQWSGG